MFTQMPSGHGKRKDILLGWLTLKGNPSHTKVEKRVPWRWATGQLSSGVAWRCGGYIPLVQGGRPSPPHLQTTRLAPLVRAQDGRLNVDGIWPGGLSDILNCVPIHNLCIIGQNSFLLFVLTCLSSLHDNLMVFSSVQWSRLAFSFWCASVPEAATEAPNREERHGSLNRTDNGPYLSLSQPAHCSSLGWN